MNDLNFGATLKFVKSQAAHKKKEIVQSRANFKFAAKSIKTKVRNNSKDANLVLAVGEKSNLKKTENNKMAVNIQIEDGDFEMYEVEAAADPGPIVEVEVPEPNNNDGKATPVVDPGMDGDDEDEPLESDGDGDAQDEEEDDIWSGSSVSSNDMPETESDDFSDDCGHGSCQGVGRCIEGEPQCEFCNCKISKCECNMGPLGSPAPTIEISSTDSSVVAMETGFRQTRQL